MNHAQSGDHGRLRPQNAGAERDTHKASGTRGFTLIVRPASFWTNGQIDRPVPILWNLNRCQSRTGLAFAQDQIHASRRLTLEKCGRRYRRLDTRNVPSLRLLGRFPGDSLPSFLLENDSLWAGLNNGVPCFQGDDPIDPQLGGFLDDPIHSLALEKRTAENDGRAGPNRSRVLFKDARPEFAPRFINDLDEITPLPFVTEPHVRATPHPETFSQMLPQGAADSDLSAQRLVW